MPNTSSARKSLRVGIRRNQENKSTKLRVKQALKKATSENWTEVVSTIDKAAKLNVMHKNKAARLKSRLMKTIAVSPEGAAKETKKVVKKTAAKKTTAKKTATKKTTTKKTTKK